MEGMIFRLLCVCSILVLAVTGQLRYFGPGGDGFHSDVYLRHNSFTKMECTKFPRRMSFAGNGNLFPVYNLTVFKSRYPSYPFVLRFSSLTNMDPSQTIKVLINLIRSCFPEQFQRPNAVMENRFYPLPQVTDVHEEILEKNGKVNNVFEKEVPRFIDANALMKPSSDTTCLKFIENIPSNIYNKLVPLFTMTAYSSSTTPNDLVLKLTSYKASVQPSSINTLLANLIRSCYSVLRHKRAHSVANTWMRSSSTSNSNFIPNQPTMNRMGFQKGLYYNHYRSYY